MAVVFEIYAILQKILDDFIIAVGEGGFECFLYIHSENLNELQIGPYKLFQGL